jgi:hypothetical protein
LIFFKKKVEETTQPRINWAGVEFSPIQTQPEGARLQRNHFSPSGPRLKSIFYFQDKQVAVGLPTVTVYCHYYINYVIKILLFKPLSRLSFSEYLEYILEVNSSIVNSNIAFRKEY